MTDPIEVLRGRKNQAFDGEAHLTNEELDALLDLVETQRTHWQDDPEDCRIVDEAWAKLASACQGR